MHHEHHTEERLQEQDLDPGHVHHQQQGLQDPQLTVREHLCDPVRARADMEQLQAECQGAVQDGLGEDSQNLKMVILENVPIRLHSVSAGIRKLFVQYRRSEAAVA